MALLAHPAVAALSALFVWWFSTGMVLWIIGSSRCNSRWGLFGAVVLSSASLYGLGRSAADTSVVGAYVAFTCAVLLWGTQEFGFLAGYITGPRNQPCPDNVTGWRRAALAVEAVLYHEFALVLSGLAVIAATWNAENQFGTWTYLILWAMRVSAELNLFLGVPVLNDEFLPKRLSHLTSYFVRKPVSPFFPLVVTVATAVTTLLVARALSGEGGAFAPTGYMLLASLLALGALEHWFMVLPLPIAALWGWSMRSRTDLTSGPGTPLARNARMRSTVTKVPDP